MLQLDCSSRESTLESVAEIYSCAPERIESFIHGWDIDAYWQKEDPWDPPCDVLQTIFESNLDVRAASIARVCWFHGTRSLPDVTYSEGIFPLELALPHVWQTFERVFVGTRHAERLVCMRKNGVNDRQFAWKKNNPQLDGGPFGMLVRDVLFSPREISNYDYLGLGEIAADICNGYFQSYSEKIDEQLKAALVPTIVKFWSEVNRDIPNMYVTRALYYLYLSTRGLPLVMECNTCFDGKNIVMPASKIISVERVC
jgi:hypothetical protein